MDKQLSLSALNDELAQVRTRKKEFLSQIERIIPWGEWIALIRPYYYKGARRTIAAIPMRLRTVIIILPFFTRLRADNALMKATAF